MLSIKTLFITLVVLLLVAVLDWYTHFFGKMLNRFFPCEQDPQNSLPCFMTYDLAFLAVLGVLSLIVLGLLVVKVAQQ